MKTFIRSKHFHNKIPEIRSILESKDHTISSGEFPEFIVPMFNQQDFIVHMDNRTGSHSEF